MPEAIPSSPKRKFVHLRSSGVFYSQRHRDSLKRSLDVLISLVVLAFCLPIFAVVATLLLVEGGGIIFRQKREGRNGARFFCLKFRTMVPDAQRVLDEYLAMNPVARGEWQAKHKLKADPRITKLGRFLRKTSIDELPQLINVLKGDMSLVGPRPIVAEEIVRYGQAIEYYYRCRPGLTGPWQIGGRNDVAYGRRVSMDVDYATNPSIRRDIRILAKTPIIVLRGTGAS